VDFKKIGPPKRTLVDALLADSNTPLSATLGKKLRLLKEVDDNMWSPLQRLAYPLLKRA
jgi:hypothetical protein